MFKKIKYDSDYKKFIIHFEKGEFKRIYFNDNELLELYNLVRKVKRRELKERNEM